ncbi:uncharacterized protein L199_001070 [Kwoniella botswanensis]|uniref:uncharacterized protein n=1 Tax=Kwoniella botswanensis TaxID=1268659 RepID=UPI00315C8F5E
MAGQTMSEDELRKLRASIGSRKTSLACLQARSYRRGLNKIKAEPDAEAFSFLENVKNYLSTQKGKNPMKSIGRTMSKRCAGCSANKNTLGQRLSLDSLADWRPTTQNSERAALISGQASDSEAESEVRDGEVDYFDENDMRKHRLTLFGLSLAGREDQEVEIQASRNPHMQGRGRASKHPEENDTSEEAANSDDTFFLNTNVTDSVRPRAKLFLFRGLPVTPFTRDQMTDSVLKQN